MPNIEIKRKMMMIMYPIEYSMGFLGNMTLN
jgi:hypothetical protein